MPDMLRTLSDLDVAAKRVLVRVDFNVPLAGQTVTDDVRIRAALPTIRWLLDRGARVILASHLGRPRGQVVDKYRLGPVALRLSELLARPVTLAPDCIGPEVVRLSHEFDPTTVLVLENLRFHPEEERNDPGFARALAAVADAYVNDAFGAAHRAHASIVGVAGLVPSAAGLLLAREIEVLGQALHRPARPFVAVLGGAKVSDKMGVIANLLARVDALLLGGGMANTLLAAAGCDVRESLYEPDWVDRARGLIADAAGRGVELGLPDDVVVARTIEAGAPSRTVSVSEVPEGFRIVDVGPDTGDRYRRLVLSAGTVLWNGPLGVFEIPEFSPGTMAFARAVADCPGLTIVGGGDSAAAVTRAGVRDRIGHLSTGGGATLEFLEGRTLPGVAVLMKEAS